MYCASVRSYRSLEWLVLNKPEAFNYSKEEYEAVKNKTEAEILAKKLKFCQKFEEKNFTGAGECKPDYGTLDYIMKKGQFKAGKIVKGLRQ